MKTTFPLRAALLLFLVLFIASCKDEDIGPCGFIPNTVVQRVYPDSLSTELIPYIGTLTDNADSVIYYLYSGTRVTFFIGLNVPGICTENHLHPSFSVTTTALASSVKAKIYFEAYWSALFPGESFVAIDDTLKNNHNYTGTLECGLKQVFQDNPANVDLYANVEFDGAGDINFDKVTLAYIIGKLEISCTYDQDI